MISEKKKDFNEEYKDIIHNLDVGFFRIGLDGTILNHNPKFNEIFGISPNENLVGTISFDFWQQAEDRDKFVAELKSKGYVKNYVTHARKVTGEEIVVQGNSHLVRDEEDNPIATEGTIIDISEKYYLEQKLKASEEKYRDLTEFSPDIIFETDLNLNLIYVNSIALEKFGYTKEDVDEGINVIQLIDPDYKEKAYSKIKAIFDGKKTNPDTYLLRKKDETPLYARIHSRPIIVNGSVVGMRGTITDINDRIIAEQELKESEEKFRTIAEQSFMGIIIIQDGVFKYFNEQARNLNGYSSEEIKNWKPYEFSKLIHPEDKEFVIEQARKKESGNNNVVNNHKYRMITNTGEIRWIENYSKSITYKGRPADLIMSVDITDNIIANNKLKENEEKYRSLFENMNAGFAYHEVVVNENNQPIDYIYHEVNPAFENLTGMKREDLIGKRVTEAIPGTENDPADWIGKFGDVALTGNPLTVENYFEVIDRWFKVSGYSPKKGFFAVTFSDITEIKKAEESLRESELKFSTIAEQSLLGIAILQDDKFKYINSKFADICGRTEEEISNWGPRDFINFVHPEDKVKVLEQAKKRQLGVDTEITGYECRAFKRNGELMWVQTYSKTITYNGKFADLVTILDITDRKLTEENLKESELKFRTIAEQSLMGIGIIQDFDIKYVNQQMTDIYGYPYDEVTNWEPKEFIKVIHPDSREMALSQIIKKQQGDSDVVTQYIAKIITKNGNVKWVENYSTPISYQGKPADLLTQIDITPRMDAENKIRASEEKYHHLYESSPYAIILFNIKGEIIDCNLTSERLSGFSKEDLVGKNFQNITFIPKEYIPFALEDFKNLLKGKTIEPKEIKLYTKKGELKWVSYHASIFYIEKEMVFQILIQDITDRKKAEQELIDSEEKYHNLFETSPNGVVLTDLSGKIIECNSAIEIIFGYSPEELIDRKFTDLDVYKENGLEIILNGFKDLFGDNELEYVELPVNHQDGHTIWVRINSSLITMEDQKYILAVIHNVTTQKTAEDALKRSEEKYRDLLQTSSVGVLEIDLIKMKLTYINPKLLAIIGYERDELTEEIFMNKLIHQKDLTKILRSNEEADVEFRIFDKQGKLKWLSGRRIPNYNEKKELIGIRIWLDDITEKKMYEELIYELNINFLNFTTDIRNNIDLLLNTGLKLLKGDLILYAHKLDSEEDDKYQIITSDNETFTFESKEFKEKLIASDLLIEGHDFPQTFFDIDENKFADSDPFIKNINAKGCFGKVIKSQEGSENLVCVFYKNNPLISGQDKLVLFLICDAIEIEQRRWQVQQDLEKQNITLDKINKLKTELFSRTSHELKTPLISIKGFTELLLTLHKSKLDTETISILEEIKDGGKRLEKIINLLLESTKLEAGQLELNLAKEDLTFLINFCVKELKGLARLRNQTIIFDAEDKIEATFDKERIYEVISNLLLNAVKYTSPGGTISIQTQSDNDSFIISVKDNGIGFTEEEKGQVFKQFGKIERYGQGWDVAIEGTGLGLYITKKLVELHDGKIWLESEGRNKGTTFFFSIPKL